MKPIDRATRFDAICPLPDLSPSEYLRAAEAHGITTLFVFLKEKAQAAWRELEASDSIVILSPEAWDKPERPIRDRYLSFARFPYGDRLWNLSNPDELSALLSHLGDVEEFLSLYKATFQKALKVSKSKIALGLESVGNALGKPVRESTHYRKTMLDLTDCLVGGGFAIGYAMGNPCTDLSSVVLRRIAELRGDLLIASFAEEPDQVGQGIQKSVLSARASGFGGYLQYSNREQMRVPCGTQKETL